MFTDIVGSTDKWEHHGNAFLPVLQAHNAILSDAIQRYNGYVMKTEGDSYKVAFSNPKDAIRCSIVAQAALQRFPWPQDVGNIEVRMAIHTGKPFTQAGDYFGPPVNRAARILSASNGGQVLISDETIKTIKGVAEPGIKFIDQDHHRLKDLDEPIHLFQISHPRLESRPYPPPASLNGVPNNLPTQRRSFVGREKEIEKIAALFAHSDTRLLNITGPEGSGKTRLSQQAAAELNHLFPDGLFLVDISKANDLESAAEIVARSIGCDLNPDGTRLEALRTWMANQKCLLILDDASSFPQADSFIREILSGAAHLRCVATSKESLDIERAERLEVPTLSVPPEYASPEQIMESETGRLLVDRIVEQRPDFDLSGTRSKTLGRLARLITLPGAIEKAAEVFKTDPKALETQLKEIAVKAASLSQTAINLGKQTLGINEQADQWRTQAETHMKTGQLADAEGNYLRALNFYRQTENKVKIAETLHKLGKIAFDQKQFDRAVTLLDASLATFHEIRNASALAVRIELENARRAQGSYRQSLSLNQALGQSE